MGITLNLKGHIGFTITFLSLMFLALGFKDPYYVKIIILSAAFSSLPDIDLRLGLPHRKYTHNILFIAITSLPLGYLTSILLNDFNLGFYSALLSGISHLLCDLITYMEFAPLYPFSNKNIALRLFRSSNEFINNVFIVSGMLLLILYIIYL